MTEEPARRRGLRISAWATRFLFGALLPPLAVVPAISAQVPIFESEPFSLGISGYFRSLTGIHDAGFDLPSAERRSGFHGDVARLKWRARWSDRWVLEVHNRAQVTVSSSDAGFGGAVSGFGVSADPGRSIDLETAWVDQERLRAWHDIDRFALTVYTPTADITVGRQAITWGIALLFPIADLWAQFSPFELDTEEKPGVDAVRILAYPASGLELDAVIADRGVRDDLSAGLRATWSLASADAYGAVGRFWNEAVLMGGVAWLFDTWKLRGEAVSARDLDLERWLDPRMTLGLDRLGPRLTLSAEYHFNGLGGGEAAEYLSRLQGESFSRGESYFLGRHYLGRVGLVDTRRRAEGAALGPRPRESA